MKKLSLLLLVSLLAFYSCSSDNDEINGGDEISGGDEKKEVVISFEDQLTEPESEFISAKPIDPSTFSKDTFTDPNGNVKFDHYYADWGTGYSFAGFTYTNKTNYTMKCQPNCGYAKSGKVYLGVYSNEYSPASITIVNPQYAIKGVWITNSKNAYDGMTEGDNWATAFKAGSWYNVTATGFNNKGDKIAEATIKLADYKNDTDKPINTWIWFDLTALQGAAKITFTPSSSDSDETNGMKTAQYFCMDDLTLIEKAIN